MNQYRNNYYLSSERLYAYLEQFKQLGSDRVKTVLEIGKGPGVFESIVKIAGYDYISIDYNINVKPHIVADITNLSIKDNSFDHVYCCQVLEHLPFNKFWKSISELCRIAKTKIIISLPDNRKPFRININLFRLKIQRVFSIPKTGKNILEKPSDQHFWEIGYSQNKNCIAEKEILSILKDLSNIESIFDYRLYERPYQHFFILTKKASQ